MKTSGIRLGSPAMTTRGLTEQDFHEIGLIISKCLSERGNTKVIKELKERVRHLIEKCNF